MMKRIIQICSMLALTAAFFAVSAQAQAGNRIEAKIPFNFNIGGKSYQAGDYVLRLSKVSNIVVGLSLEDSAGNQLQNVLVSTSGKVANGEERLVFDLHGDRRYLSEVLTNSKGFSLWLSIRKRPPAGKQPPPGK